MGIKLTKTESEHLNHTIYDIVVPHFEKDIYSLVQRSMWFFLREHYPDLAGNERQIFEAFFFRKTMQALKARTKRFPLDAIPAKYTRL